MMDIKEKLIGNVVTILSVDLTSEQLRLIKNCMTTILQDYDVVEHTELPSTEVVNDVHILKHFAAAKKISGCSIKTIKQYGYHIRKFLDYVNMPITDITTNTIRYYLAYLGQSCSNCYIDNVRRVLNSFFSFCENEEYIVKNPCKKIDKIKYFTEMKQPYTDVEVELIRRACDTPREKALVNLLFSTGARREELTKIKVSDIDFADRSIRINGKGGKIRTVHFSARCELSIKEYLDSKRLNSEYLFSSERDVGSDGKLYCETLAKIIKEVEKKSGLSDVHLHKFRHWFATYMANRGVPLQDLKEMMGHTSVNTTDRHYVYSDVNRITYEFKRNAV
jgi:site-specific recombinase XerD